MGSLIGLKNVIIFSAVLLAIGSVSSQQAFAVDPCHSAGDGNWNDPSNWSDCGGGTPNVNTDADINAGDNIIITGDEETQILTVTEASTLFIDCDASLNLFSPGSVNLKSNVTNHGNLTSVPSFVIFGGPNFFNSGTFSGVVVEAGDVVQISTICTQPIGGTVGSMDTASLLVAGAQANTGWWIIALVGVVAVAGIAYKAKTNKTHKETL